MKNPTRLAYIFILIIVSFLMGSWFAPRNAVRQSGPAGRKILYWHDPMHPAYKAEAPGIAPDCGMQLEPVYESSKPSAPTGELLPPGAVQISSTQQQLIGLRTAVIHRSRGSTTLRTTGRVITDETRTYVINATVDGWITSAGTQATGSIVRKNEVLATFYSPEFLSAVQAYLFALSSIDRVRTTGKENTAQKDQLAQFNINLQQYKDSLRNLGMGSLQIDELTHSHNFTESIDVTAPAAGIVLVRKVSHGLRFSKGDELYRIANLARVWILVDVYEVEERSLRPGSRVQVSLPNQGISLQARVGNALPQFDSVSRTLKVRLEAENPRFQLLPDMFVDVEFPVQFPDVLMAPAEAVVNTGLRKTVFVDMGNGFFEPRHVESGRRFGRQIEITKGLNEGERIVVSGNFLVDSESRMKAMASGATSTTENFTIQQDPVCGMDVDEKRAAAAGRRVEHHGQIYYFCSDDCQKRFATQPGQFARK